MIRLKSGVIVVIAVWLVGCRHEPISALPPAKEIPEYSFFVAGHSYGDIHTQTLGFHPPFRKYFDSLNALPALELGIFTGDMVAQSTKEAWDTLDQELLLLKDRNENILPTYIAVGNHDIEYPVYKARYGDTTFFSFFHRKDLFIIIDPSLDKWNITGDQMDFLKNTLETDAPEAVNIFVFFHQLLWWEEYNQFRNVLPNNTYHRADSVNFWPEVEPMFKSLEKPVIMFAGDVGPFPPYQSGREAFMYYQYDNITLIASGMGNYETDNIVTVHIMPDKSVKYELIALNGDNPNALGSLVDFVMP